MRGATQCARRLRQLLRSLRTKLGKVNRPPTGDAVTQMILGVFSRDVPDSKAREALDRLRSLVVDYNELRVVPPIEMAGMVGALPEARVKCEDLSRALNKVFMHEHEVSLERLAELPRKEVIAYLESIDGLDPYSRARVRLLGLQQHAVPLDEAMWAYARKTEIVERRCPLGEAQAFLERRVPEGDALEFVALLEKQAWAEMGAAVRSGEVEEICSVPPDRTARNMLQLVASGAASSAGESRPQTREAAKQRPGAVGTRAGKAGRSAKTPKKPKTRKAAKRRRVARPAAKPKVKPAAGRAVRRTARPKRKSKPAVRGKPNVKRSVRARTMKRTRRVSAKAKSA